MMREEKLCYHSVLDFTDDWLAIIIITGQYIIVVRCILNGDFYSAFRFVLIR